MEDNKGTDAGAGCSDWFLVEADCSDTSDLENDLEKLFNEETDSDISDLLDDGDIEQGNSRELLCQQETEESEQQVQLLKRKYLSPKAISQLSPRLESISLSPQHKSKKRLFVEQDSGLELSLNEVEDITEEVEVPASASVPAAQGGKGVGGTHFKELLKSSNVKATLMGKFKDAFGVGFKGRESLPTSFNRCAGLSWWCCFFYFKTIPRR